MESPASLRSNQKQYLIGLRNLMDYIEAKNPTPLELCTFICQETLTAQACSVVFFSKLNNDGTINLISDIGLNEDSHASWANVAITSDLPVPDAIKQDDIIWYNNYLDMWENYSELTAFPVKEHVASFVALPVDAEGYAKIVLGLMFDKTLRQDPDLSMFIWTIGALVSMYFTHTWRKQLEAEPQQMSNFYFTLRQREILQMLADGLTNSQIAHQLGFSESTIRHETMRIYRALQADGRKDAVAIALRAGLLT